MVIFHCFESELDNSRLKNGTKLQKKIQSRKFYSNNIQKTSIFLQTGMRRILRYGFFFVILRKFSQATDLSMKNTDSDDLNLSTDMVDTASTESPKKHKRRHTPFLLLLNILMTGTAGWKDLRRSRLTPEQTAAGCFYPLIALASACRFADWFYLPEFNLSETLVSAVSVFVSFFFSYFAIQVVCRWLFPTAVKSKTETAYFKLMVQYALSSLALFLIPAEVLPILETITVFLPIWTAFIITKGIRFMVIPNQFLNRCMVTIVVTVIVTPYLLMWLCDKIL